MKRRSISLAEVMCLIAIVAVLAVMFWPVYATADGDNHVTCAGNMRQIGQAFVMYARENNDRLPNPYSASNLDKWYDKFLKPYLRDASVTRCPSTEGRGWNPYSNAPSAADYIYPGFGQMYSSGDGTLEKPYLGYPGGQLSSFKYPSLFLMSRDLQAVIDNTSVPPHNDGYNWVAVDGHVRWMTWPDIYAVGLLHGKYHYIHQYAIQYVR